jgi:hypothetical protein
MISDAALGVENNENTVTVTPPSSQTLPSISHQPNLELQCQDPFRPTAWRGLTSIVRKPQRWQLTSSTPLKTTKIPLRFRQPTTTAKRSRVSSLRDSDSTTLSLPKGWVYEAEEVVAGVKVEVVNPGKYQMLDVPLTRHKRRIREIEDAQLQDPYRQHRRASNTIGVPLSSHSASKTTAVKRRRGISGPILTVTVSPSPQSKDEENEKLHKLREYARDFRRQHTTDAEQFDWDSDDGDYGLAIGRLVVT